MPVRRVRVTHISQDARRHELKDLFRECGAIYDFWKSGSRAYIVRIWIFGYGRMDGIGYIFFGWSDPFFKADPSYYNIYVICLIGI